MAPRPLKHSCALDVADLEGLTLREVGEILGCTRERVRQIQDEAVTKIKQMMADYSDVI